MASKVYHRNIRELLRRLRRLGAFGLLTALAAGCAMGGGTIGTGIGPSHFSGSGAGAVDTDVLYFDLNGVLQNQQGIAIPNVKISAVTPRADDSTVTDANGKFAVAIVVSKTESITLRFHGANVRSELTLKGKSEDLSGAEAVFVVVGAGKVQLKRIVH